MLAPAFQARLSQRLERSDRGQLTVDEVQELDELLARIDILDTLKARALYTLRAIAETN